MINITDFLADIEVLHETLSYTYMEAIVYWCEAKGIDVESVSALIKKNRVLKSKLKVEAEHLNFLKKKKTSKLPL